MERVYSNEDIRCSGCKKLIKKGEEHWITSWDDRGYYCKNCCIKVEKELDDLTNYRKGKRTK